MTSRAQLLKCSVAIFWVTVASIVTLPTIAFSEAGTFSDVSDINKTTSRYKRTKYMCMISTDDGRKPLPKGMDHFRMSRSHYGVADLYGDGSLDMFFGFSDDTFPIERISESDRKFYEGNEDRSRKNFQYSFYSEVDNFVVPNGTKYLVGRSFAVQDYNSDGVDDYIVAQWGTDYPPQSRRNNEILLSSSSGYISGNLPGGTGYNHSAAAGDIDEDGDVDVVIGQPTTPGRLLFYINDERGNFPLHQKLASQLKAETTMLAQYRFGMSMVMVTLTCL